MYNHVPFKDVGRVPLRWYSVQLVVYYIRRFLWASKCKLPGGMTWYDLDAPPKKCKIRWWGWWMVITSALLRIAQSKIFMIHSHQHLTSINFNPNKSQSSHSTFLHPEWPGIVHSISTLSFCKPPGLLNGMVHRFNLKTTHLLSLGPWDFWEPPFLKVFRLTHLSDACSNLGAL